MCDLLLIKELKFSLSTLVCIFCALLARKRRGSKRIFVGVSQIFFLKGLGGSFFLGGGGKLNFAPTPRRGGLGGGGANPHPLKFSRT